MRKKTQFLNSTKIFEDVIYQEVVALFKKEPSALNDNLILSWIIDLDSEFITERFLDDELLQLKSWRLPLPEMGESFAFSLGRFSKVSEGYAMFYSLSKGTGSLLASGAGGC